ncbi:O-antigen ligase family protein [Cellulomonas sp. P22]|uniref:O-antigen ligase family protein n=1 Tax=Cellulomonas sp. P22 TaxID=3373189 RepID=UPI00379CDAD6
MSTSTSSDQRLEPEARTAEPSFAGHGARIGRHVLAVVAVLVLGLGVTVLTSARPALVLVVGGVALTVGLTLRQPALVPALAMPAMVLVNRVVGGDGVLSISDLVLFLAFWPALLLGARPFSPALRSLLWASAVYQALTLFTVIVNPYAANTVEWFHAWLLVSGALVVGWAVGAGGHARLGLGLLVGVAACVAVLACVVWVGEAVQGRFGPVYLEEPLLMHKNYLGGLLAFAAVVVYVRPTWLRWDDAVCLALFALFVLGILASQSRQAMLGLAVAVTVVALRPDPHRRRSRVVLVAVVAATVAVLSLVRDQIASGDVHNSANQRLAWFEQSIAIWQHDPLFGAGLRWWYTDRFPERFQPPNAEFEVLSSAGVVGLVGFVLLVVVALVVLWRVDPQFGTLAFAIVLMRVVQGQFDLFWVAAQVSIPFAVAGVCLGAQAFAAQHPPRSHGLALPEPEQVRGR